MRRRKAKVEKRFPEREMRFGDAYLGRKWRTGLQKTFQKNGVRSDFPSEAYEYRITLSGSTIRGIQELLLQYKRLNPWGEARE